MIDMLLTRRSVLAANMTDEGPGPEDVRSILEAGHRVPDHGKLGPWRFLVFEGEARAAFGDVLKKAFLAAQPEADAGRADMEALRFLRAPTVIAVISTAAPHKKIPEWEQYLAVGAVCQNMLVAATALGYASQWLTEWYAYDPAVIEALGLHAGERVAGFIYLGGKNEQPSERVRPDLDERIAYWKPE